MFLVCPSHKKTETEGSKRPRDYAFAPSQLPARWSTFLLPPSSLADSPYFCFLVAPYWEQKYGLSAAPQGPDWETLLYSIDTQQLN